MGLALATAFATGCGRDTRPPAAASTARPAAAPAPVTDSIPALAPSVVEAPVRYDLDPAVAAIEAAVPRTFGDLAQRKPVPGHARLTYAFVAERTPFDIAVRGSTVTVSSIVTYRAQGWYKPPIGPSLGGSCGLSGDAPRLRITLRSTVRLARDWTLHANTQVPTVEPATAEARDRCRVTKLNHDVTDRVLDAVRTRLEGKAAVLDARVGRLDVRSRVERWWALLGRPIRVADGVWLQLQPDSLRVGALRGGEGMLIAPVGLTARPRLVTGPRPDSSTAPLPDITPGAPGAGGLHLLLEAALGYGDASRMLARQLVGRRFERAGRTVTVQDARIFSARSGRVALTLRLAGDVDAQVVLVGRPVYDRGTGTLHVPDLDYAVGDASLLVKAGDQVGHDALRDALRERARWPVTAVLDSARLRAERAMNRDLTQGVHLGAHLPAARALGVFAASDALLVHADATGDLALDVNRALPIARKRGPPRPAEPPRAGAKKPGVR